MAGNAYPHIVFAKDETVLPRAELETVLQELFDGDPTAPETSQDALSVVLRRHVDERAYAFTFWYDDEADGLGDHYADYAAPIRRRRVTRCTTMIDFSGDVDPDGREAEAASRITNALAQRDGVYVFSELAKRFVGMDYDDDPTASVVPTPLPATELKTTEPAEATPALEPAGTGSDSVITPVPEEQPSAPTTPVERPAAQLPSELTPVIAPVGPGRAPAARTGPSAPGVEPTATPVPSSSPVPAPTPSEPEQTPPTPDEQDEAQDNEKDKPGFFKRVFGRQGR